MCISCATLIADVMPVEEKPKMAPSTSNNTDKYTINGKNIDSDATIVIRDWLTFLDEAGEIAFECSSGDLIGRAGAGASYLYKFKTVSRKHCQVSYGHNGWEITDASSTNGVYVNGVRITDPITLNDNDLVQLSLSCSLRIKL